MNHTVRRPFPVGSGIFETLRTEGGRVAEFGRHMRRALSASQALRIRMPSEESLRAEVERVLQENPFQLGRLRICIGKDSLAITHDEYVEVSEAGFLTFSPHTSKAKGEQFKTYPYDEHYEVVDEARAHGFDIHITQVPQAREIVLLGSLKVAQPIQQIGEMRIECGEIAQSFAAQMREKVEYFSVG